MSVFFKQLVVLFSQITDQHILLGYLLLHVFGGSRHFSQLKEVFLVDFLERLNLFLELEVGPCQFGHFPFDNLIVRLEQGYLLLQIQTILALVSVLEREFLKSHAHLQAFLLSLLELLFLPPEFGDLGFNAVQVVLQCIRAPLLLLKLRLGFVRMLHSLLGFFLLLPTEDLQNLHVLLHGDVDLLLALQDFFLTNDCPLQVFH